MRNKFLIAIALVGTIFTINSCDSEENAVPKVSVPSNCDTAGMTYSTGAGEIQTIINAQCATPGSSCHGAGATSGGKFTSYGRLGAYTSGGMYSQIYVNLEGGPTPMPNVPQPGWNLCDKLKIEAWVLAGAPQ